MSEFVAEIVELDPQEAIAKRGDVAVADLPEFFENAYIATAAAAEASGVEIIGPPFAYYPELPGGTVTVEAGFPVSAAVEADGDVHRLVLPGGRAVMATHIGPFETMEKTYAALQAWMADRDLHPAAGMWECFLSDPVTEPDPAGWRTRIYWPIA